MDRNYSTLLDLSRFIAAFLVFIHHAEQILKDNRLSPLASFGHDSVIFFFILSGFVIGFVSEFKENTLQKYATARLARLYSVAIPSLLLSFFLVWVGSLYFPENYSKFLNENWFYVILNALFFVNQSWIGGIEIPTNGPYWSVCYEAWYYVLFGISFYLSGSVRIALLLLASSLAGPRIVLLMPIWLIGFAFYRLHASLKQRKIFGYFCIIASTSFYLIFRINNWDDSLFSYSASWAGGEIKINTALGFSKRFAPDFIISALFIMILYGLLMVQTDFTISLNRMRPAISFFSSYTFSLYLLHFPILIFISHLTNNTWAALIGCLCIIVAIGYFTEKRKRHLSCLIEHTLNFLKPKPVV